MASAAIPFSCLSRARRFRPMFEYLEARDLPSAGFWNGFARDAQHTALSTVASQPLDTIRWQTPVDLNPQFRGSHLLIHYGSPMATAAGTIVIPVKTGATDGFRLEAHSGFDGSLIWSQTTDYILPAHDWTPSFPATLTPSGRLYFAGANGVVNYRDNVDSSSGATAVLVASETLDPPAELPAL